MKRILLTVVLGVAVGAGAQDAAQPAQGQPAGSQSQVIIKDPAEYNAYVAAAGAADPNAKISGLEAFLKQYPNSVMKNQALETLMGTYQATNNIKKALDIAATLAAAEPCQKGALVLLAFYDRILAQNNDPNAKQLLVDAKKYGQQGLDCLPKFPKPDGTSDADWEKTKAQMQSIFKSAIGLAALTDKDYPTAIADLRAAVDTSPDTQKDFGLVWPLTLAYLQQTPPDYQNGIWFGARAAALAPAGAAPGVEKYVRSQYVKFHAGDDGWADVLAAAKANGAQVAIKPAPTPAEQCHSMVASKKPEEMNFAEWQFAFTNCSQEDQDAVWNAIKGKAVQMNGTVISTTPTEFSIAGSSDDIDAGKPDITLKFEDKVPVKLIPKDKASFDFQGEPSSYTANPFMMVMEKGQLLRAKAATPTPVHKPPVHKKPS